MFLSEWREFPSAPCLAGKKNLMKARVSMLLKTRVPLTFFRACFLPGRAKNLSAPRYFKRNQLSSTIPVCFTFFFHLRARSSELSLAPSSTRAI